VHSHAASLGASCGAVNMRAPVVLTILSLEPASSSRDRVDRPNSCSSSTRRQVSVKRRLSCGMMELMNWRAWPPKQSSSSSWPRDNMGTSAALAKPSNGIDAEAKADAKDVPPLATSCSSSAYVGTFRKGGSLGHTQDATRRRLLQTKLHTAGRTPSSSKTFKTSVTSDTNTLSMLLSALAGVSKCFIWEAWLGAGRWSRGAGERGSGAYLALLRKKCCLVAVDSSLVSGGVALGAY
jgi:hypothetical protein